MALQNHQTVNETSPSEWYTDNSKFEKTRSAQIISSTLEQLKDRNKYFVLVHKNYQSGITVLVDINEDGLLIDKPVDWPGNFSVFRVVFKDCIKVINHFKVSLLKEEEDKLYTSLPSELCRLQRRSYFRIDASQPNQAFFVHKGKMCEGFAVENISANGMLVSTKENISLPHGDTITDVSLAFSSSLPNENCRKSQPCLLRINSGSVIRDFSDPKKSVRFYGITFPSLHKREEQSLAQYVFNREQELRRKGCRPESYI